MKELTGGDKIIARALHKDPIEFKPQFKMVMTCNKLIKPSSNDDGVWRRMSVVDFPSKFVDSPDPKNKFEFKIDDTLNDKLQIWPEAFIYLLINEYYVKFKSSGIREPAEVKKNNAEYKADSDIFTLFIQEKIEEDCSNDKGVKIIVNHSRRFDPKMIQLKKLISKNFFGSPLKININYYGGWKNNGTHIIDTILYLFEKELEYVKSGKIENSRHLNDPTIDFHLRFKNSSVDIHINGFNEDFYQIFDFEFRFDKSRLRIEDFGNRIIYEKMITNNMQENVLEIRKINLESNLVSSIENSINIIRKYLNGNNDIINNLTINDISKTMKFVWQYEK